jgi:hypothetical protein
MPEFELIMKSIQSLVDIAASGKIHAKHLDLLRAQVSDAQQRHAQAEALVHELQSKCLALEQSLEQCQLKLKRFANDNPFGHRCDHCGGVDLRLTGQQPAQTGAEFGLRDGIYLCRVCQHTSVHAMPPPG